MPIGASIAVVERINPRWLEVEARHGVIVFGGDALLSAVTLVLVSKGVSNLSSFLIVAGFSDGALIFMLLDIQLTANNAPFSRLRNR